MSENRDDEEDWSQVDKSVKVLARAVEEHDKDQPLLLLYTVAHNLDKHNEPFSVFRKLC